MIDFLHPVKCFEMFRASNVSENRSSLTGNLQEIAQKIFRSLLILDSDEWGSGAWGGLSENAPIGLHIWIFGPLLMELFGED